VARRPPRRHHRGGKRRSAHRRLTAYGELLSAARKHSVAVLTVAIQPHVVAENDRVASISVWDGTIPASGQAVDFTSADFLRIENGVAAEHWDTVDYVRLHQAFGLLPQLL
jgi:predicted ester cyclase